MPLDVQTVGDHLRQRRAEMCKTMKQVGHELGVTASTMWNWENNRTQPEQRYLPVIIRFLGYNPLPVAEDLADELKRVRMGLGFSQEQLAQKLGVNESTIAQWERRDKTPSGVYRALVNSFVNADGNIRKADEPSENPHTFSPAAFASARQRLRLTGPALARHLGVSAHTVSCWERGERTPRGLHREIAARIILESS